MNRGLWLRLLPAALAFYTMKAQGQPVPFAAPAQPASVAGASAGTPAPDAPPPGDPMGPFGQGSSSGAGAWAAGTAEASAQGLIRRLLPTRVGDFIVERLDAGPDAAAGHASGRADGQAAGRVDGYASGHADSRDVFEIESRGRRIVLRGNTGVSIASALYYYLTEYAHCQVTWNGSNLRLPAVLPRVPFLVRRRTPYPWRYYLNYCTFNYSMTWWSWDRWEKEIDWMALHGINMPLAITGEEATWRNVYRSMGLSDTDLAHFFAGPAYLAWGWMGNLDGWGGPLPASWIDGHEALEKKILDRERALGMIPVLPAFTGHVPAAIARKFPTARLTRTNWHNGFDDTYILDPLDPLFADIARRFLREQERLYGTDHLYSADTFNENEPAAGDSASLASLSARIYAGMRAADPEAVWVMQGWLFYSDRKYWTEPRVRALLGAVPNDRMILLDLAAEISPVWKRTHSFYGKPWIWCQLNNFGGNVNLFGRIEGVAAGPAEALAANRAAADSVATATAPGPLSGIGLTMEAIAQNPVIYELTMTHAWRDSAVDLDHWLPAYARNRYGVDNAQADSAWTVLRHTVYNGQKIRDGAESIITARPTLDSQAVWTQTILNYDPADLLPAWDFLIKAAPACASSEGFRYDLVDVTRQVLANYALPLQRRWVDAYRRGDTATFDIESARFLDLISDLDTLLRTQRDFLLGPWLADARAWGKTPGEKALYERNARDLLTLWGGAESPLHEYANRQWSGLLNDFYRERWVHFFQFLRTHRLPDLAAFEPEIRAWEWDWVNRQNAFPTTPQGNPVATAQRLYDKYRAACVKNEPASAKNN